SHREQASDAVSERVQSHDVSLIGLSWNSIHTSGHRIAGVYLVDVRTWNLTVEIDAGSADNPNDRRALTGHRSRLHRPTGNHARERSKDLRVGYRLLRNVDLSPSRIELSTRAIHLRVRRIQLIFQQWIQSLLILSRSQILN